MFKFSSAAFDPSVAVALSAVNFLGAPAVAQRDYNIPRVPECLSLRPK